MKNKPEFLLIISAFITAGFTVAVKTVDVQPIGPAETSVGFATINQKWAEKIGVNYTWYNLATLLGLVVIAIFLVFAMVGLVQLIKRRSLFKVDMNILCLGAIYLAVFLLYVMFEKVIVNYRPVIMPGETMPEASFPSSHTMMAIVVIIGAMLQLKYYVKKRSTRLFLQVDLAVILICAVASRVLSGAHWLTDIVAGTLYSLTLLSVYAVLMHAANRYNPANRHVAKH